MSSNGAAGGKVGGAVAESLSNDGSGNQLNQFPTSRSNKQNVSHPEGTTMDKQQQQHSTNRSLNDNSTNMTQSPTSAAASSASASVEHSESPSASSTPSLGTKAETKADENENANADAIANADVLASLTNHLNPPEAEGSAQLNDGSQDALAVTQIQHQRQHQDQQQSQAAPPVNKPVDIAASSSTSNISASTQPTGNQQQQQSSSSSPSPTSNATPPSSLPDDLSSSALQQQQMLLQQMLASQIPNLQNLTNEQQAELYQHLLLQQQQQFLAQQQQQRQHIPHHPPHQLPPQHSQSHSPPQSVSIPFDEATIHFLLNHPYSSLHPAAITQLAQRGDGIALALHQLIQHQLMYQQQQQHLQSIQSPLLSHQSSAQSIQSPQHQPQAQAPTQSQTHQQQQQPHPSFQGNAFLTQYGSAPSVQLMTQSGLQNFHMIPINNINPTMLHSTFPADTIFMQDQHGNTYAAVDVRHNNAGALSAAAMSTMNINSNNLNVNPHDLLSAQQQMLYQQQLLYQQELNELHLRGQAEGVQQLQGQAAGQEQEYGVGQGSYEVQDDGQEEVLDSSQNAKFTAMAKQQQKKQQQLQQTSTNDSVASPTTSQPTSAATPRPIRPSKHAKQQQPSAATAKGPALQQGLSSVLPPTPASSSSSQTEPSHSSSTVKPSDAQLPHPQPPSRKRTKPSAAAGTTTSTPASASIQQQPHDTQLEAQSHSSATYVDKTAPLVAPTVTASVKPASKKVSRRTTTSKRNAEAAPAADPIIAYTTAPSAEGVEDGVDRRDRNRERAEGTTQLSSSTSTSQRRTARQVAIAAAVAAGLPQRASRRNANKQSSNLSATAASIGVDDGSMHTAAAGLASASSMTSSSNHLSSTINQTSISPAVLSGSYNSAYGGGSLAIPSSPLRALPTYGSLLPRKSKHSGHASLIVHKRKIAKFNLKHPFHEDESGEKLEKQRYLRLMIARHKLQYQSTKDRKHIVRVFTDIQRQIREQIKQLQGLQDDMFVNIIWNNKMSDDADAADIVSVEFSLNDLSLLPEHSRDVEEAKKQLLRINELRRGSGAVEKLVTPELESLVEESMVLKQKLNDSQRLLKRQSRVVQMHQKLKASLFDELKNKLLIEAKERAAKQQQERREAERRRQQQAALEYEKAQSQLIYATQTEEKTGSGAGAGKAAVTTESKGSGGDIDAAGGSGVARKKREVDPFDPSAFSPLHPSTVEEEDEEEGEDEDEEGEEEKDVSMTPTEIDVDISSPVVAHKPGTGTPPTPIRQQQLQHRFPSPIKSNMKYMNQASRFPAPSSPQTQPPASASAHAQHQSPHRYMNMNVNMQMHNTPALSPGGIARRGHPYGSRYMSATPNNRYAYMQGYGNANRRPSLDTGAGAAPLAPDKGRAQAPRMQPPPPSGLDMESDSNAPFHRPSHPLGMGMQPHAPPPPPPSHQSPQRPSFYGAHQFGQPSRLPYAHPHPAQHLHAHPHPHPHQHPHDAPYRAPQMMGGAVPRPMPAAPPHQWGHHPPAPPPPQPHPHMPPAAVHNMNMNPNLTHTPPPPSFGGGRGRGKFDRSYQVFR